MAERMKGITVEIGGDTTKFSQVLSGVNKDIGNTQSQLINHESHSYCVSDLIIINNQSGDVSFDCLLWFVGI